MGDVKLSEFKVMKTMKKGEVKYFHLFDLNEIKEYIAKTIETETWGVSVNVKEGYIKIQRLKLEMNDGR